MSICGTWETQSIAHIGTKDNVLNGIASISSNDVWAVGYKGSAGSERQSLVERWDGSSWNGFVAPKVLSFSSVLEDVAAIAADDVWAVGSSFEQPSALHWDGKTWEEVALPQLNSRYAVLGGVDARAPNDVWAVGYYAEPFTGTGKPSISLIMHWNGSAWSTVPVPDKGKHDDMLYDVSAIAANDVWAVGYYKDAYDAPGRAMIMHWDGKAWGIVPFAGSDAPGKILYSVSALSRSEVWAVGTTFSGTYPEETDSSNPLMLHWDGNTWREAPAQGVGTGTLSAVAVRGSEDVWAAGSRGSFTDGSSHALAMHWDGSHWQEATVPNPGSRNSLNALTVAQDGSVWLAGTTGPRQQRRTLVVQHVPAPCADTP
jgi:hypothetical protein